MKKLFLLLLAVGLLAAACGDDSKDELPAATTATEINVAYFSEWPTPNQYGQADGSFGDAVGATVNWIPFGSGNEMTEAMIAGDVDIAYSQGLTPFASAVNGGADIKLVGIAVSYSEADNCVAQGDLGVTKDNAAETLAGAKVVTPFGNVTHYKMLSMMDHLGVDLDDLDIVQAEGGATTAAAFATGDIQVGCAFGAAVVNMLDAGGKLIMSGAEHESEMSVYTYDIVSVPSKFGDENPDVVANFLRATDEFNSAWEADMLGRNPTIAKAAGMDDVGNFLGGDLWFTFPTIDEQLSNDWLGGNVAAAMQGQVETLNKLGEGAAAVGDFAGSVDTAYLEKAKG